MLAQLSLVTACQLCNSYNNFDKIEGGRKLGISIRFNRLPHINNCMPETLTLGNVLPSYLIEYGIINYS